MSRDNNDSISERYMAMFEQSTIDHCEIVIDLALESIGGQWMYANEITFAMYQSFIAGSQVGLEDSAAIRRGNMDATSESMWNSSANIVACCIDQAQTHSEKGSN